MENKSVLYIQLLEDFIYTILKKKNENEFISKYSELF